jgi:CRP-like cAMP-binding protein
MIMTQITPDINELLNSTSDLKFFKHLDDVEKTEFLKMSDVLEYDDGENIISEGEISPYFSIILNGIVNVNLNQRNKNIYLATIGKGDIIGESAIFVNFERTADITAYRKVRTLRIDRNSFIAYIKNNPSSGIKILMIIINTLLTKLHTANLELAFERTTHVEQDSIDNFINEYFSKK